MPRSSFPAMLLLPIVLAAPVRGQQPTPPPVPRDVFSTPCVEPTDRAPIPVADPALNPEPWKQTWGYASFDAIPLGGKMAPNGYAYDPLFALDLLLNVALTQDREFYLFSKARFWAQKPGDGITNSHQGIFDFSKRQFDIDAGVAWNFYESFEGRMYLYSDNNLNRGESWEKPRGYKDGFAVECRYYFPSTDFDQGLYRYLALGYYPTKEMVGANGAGFKPGFFAVANVAYDFMPEVFYVYGNFEFIAERSCDPKLLIIDPGVALRPFEKCPHLEFRLGSESTYDMEFGFTRTFLYGMARVFW